MKDICKTYPDHFVIYWKDSDGALRYRTGYNGSTLSIGEESDNKFLRATMTSSDNGGANRFKLYNILRDDRNFTQE